MWMLSAEARAGSWQPLPDQEWQPTIRSLHRWSQVVGKVRLGLAPPLNHWWHVPLYVSASGLTTSPIPYGGGLFELELDLLESALMLRSSDGSSEVLPLGPMSVATFYAEARDLLRGAGIDVRIRPVPTEVVDAIPFPEDVTPGGYEPDHARALHGALVRTSSTIAS